MLKSNDFSVVQLLFETPTTTLETGLKGKAIAMASINARPLQISGFDGSYNIHWNWTPAQFYQTAIRLEGAEVADGGALVVKTGKHTGRSAKDKFVVRDAETENTVWWNGNSAMTPEHFAALRKDFEAHMATLGSLYGQDIFGGTDLGHRLPVQIVTEYAWHGLFVHHLLRQPTASELENFNPEFTIINLPSFRADPVKHGTGSETVIAVNMTERLILIGGTSYAGETKKSVFSALNYYLPAKRVMPMHCSVNVDDEDTSTIFFGLSGTGKTTLSANPDRTLVGDDEHGWSENGLFNFEGGCYAKMINLSAAAEPEIFATTQMWGTVLENVVMDPVTRELDFDDNSLAENSRGAYDTSAIPNASETGRCGHPKTLVMLTADAFGVMPPISKLTPQQGMYHFLSGYTAKVAGTEKGVKEPTATFSACFGAPFMPRHPTVYGELLRDLIAEHNVECWLVNTGWTGGPYGTGYRMPIKATRAMLNAAMDGSLGKGRFRKDLNFGFDVPLAIEGVDAELLDPRSTWASGESYDAQAKKLVSMFIENFSKFESHVSDDIKAAAPTAA